MCRSTSQLRIPLALRHKTILRRAVQRLALGADRFRFAGVLLALLDEAVLGRAMKRLAGGADRLAFAGLRHGRAGGENDDQSGESYALHRGLPFLSAYLYI